jgi:hypothetical protein
LSNKLIPEAKDRKTVLLITVGSGHIITAVVQIEAPSITAIVLRGTPPVTVVTNVVETTTAVAETARKT